MSLMYLYGFDNKAKLLVLNVIPLGRGVRAGFTSISLASTIISKIYFPWLTEVPSKDLAIAKPRKFRIANIFYDEELM